VSEKLHYDHITDTFTPKPARPLVIQHVWAYVATDPKDGNEGVIGATMPDGTFMPLFGADEHRMRSLRPLAVRIAEEAGIEVKLVRWTTRTDMESL
jgi:hypothetical protein